jgi:hypothetical protein
MTKFITVLLSFVASGAVFAQSQQAIRDQIFGETTPSKSIRRLARDKKKKILSARGLRRSHEGLSRGRSIRWRRTKTTSAYSRSFTEAKGFFQRYVDTSKLAQRRSRSVARVGLLKRRKHEVTPRRIGSVPMTDDAAAPPSKAQPQQCDQGMGRTPRALSRDRLRHRRGEDASPQVESADTAHGGTPRMIGRALHLLRRPRSCSWLVGRRRIPPGKQPPCRPIPRPSLWRRAPVASERHSRGRAFGGSSAIQRRACRGGRLAEPGVHGPVRSGPAYSGRAHCNSFKPAVTRGQRPASLTIRVGAATLAAWPAAVRSPTSNLRPTRIRHRYTVKAASSSHVDRPSR